MFPFTWNLYIQLLILTITRTRGDIAEYRLMTDLMRNYNKKIRPSVNFTESLNVTFGLALSQIIDVDEKNQVLTTNCWLNQQWIDNKLTWSPKAYNNLKVVRIPATDVWKPDILLYNNADVMSYFSSLDSNVIVTADGNVTWLSMVIFKSSCSINVKFFPFDEQNCSMTFASWTYDGYQVNLVHNSEEGDDSNYIRNSEWELINLYQKRNVRTYSCCDAPYPDITYRIHIRRRPLYYVFNMMLPCVLITLVALLGFYIPSDSGEKVTMGITTLLSMTVFLMLVAESMPPTKNELPLLGLYYGITIAIVSFATAMTVLTLNIHHKGTRGREVPWIIKKVCFGFMAKILCLKIDIPDMTDVYIDEDIQYPEKLTTDMLENGGLVPNFATHFRQTLCGGVNSSQGQSSTTTDSFEDQFQRIMQRVYQAIQSNELRAADQDRRDIIRLEWHQVALVVDRFLLWCFVTVTVTVTLAVMLQAPSYFWTSSTDNERGRVLMQSI